MGNELEEQIYQAKRSIELGEHNLERIKKQYKEDIKEHNKYMKQRKAWLARLEKKYFSKKRN
jgi:hypothetical protein